MENREDRVRRENATDDGVDVTSGEGQETLDDTQSERTAQDNVDVQGRDSHSGTGFLTDNIEVTPPRE